MLFIDYKPTYGPKKLSSGVCNLYFTFIVAKTIFRHFPNSDNGIKGKCYTQ